MRTLVDARGLTCLTLRTNLDARDNRSVLGRTVEGHNPCKPGLWATPPYVRTCTDRVGDSVIKNESGDAVVPTLDVGDCVNRSMAKCPKWAFYPLQEPMPTKYQWQPDGVSLNIAPQQSAPVHFASNQRRDLYAQQTVERAPFNVKHNRLIIIEPPERISRAPSRYRHNEPIDYSRSHKSFLITHDLQPSARGHMASAVSATRRTRGVRSCRPSGTAD